MITITPTQMVHVLLVLVLAGFLPAALAQPRSDVFSDERLEAVTFSIPVAQIKKADVSEDGVLRIQLNAEGCNRLRVITQRDLPKPIRVVIAGYAAMHFTAVATIESGLLVVQEPKEPLLEILEPLL